ncbi:MAG TPA: DNA recombination protein RmuC, partial [Deferrisomatales bacterium]|nr:DNA recombination protein RmuC [Deferrisomatales bacterium]
MDWALDPIFRQWLHEGLTAAALLAALLAAVGVWRRRRLVEELERTLDAGLERLRTAFDGALRDGLHGVSRSQGEGALQITGCVEATRSQLLESLSARFREVQQAQEGTLTTARRSQDERLDKVEAALTGFTGSFHKAVGELENKLLGAAKSQSEQAAGSADAVQRRLARALTDLGEKHTESLGKLQDRVATELGQVRKDSEAKLEQIRATVDEKLHSTLEKRLGDSFRLVSERLELVHKGLGEMQSLASGVGDLKRVLTNVRSRGTFGEVQLEALLEQVMTPGQYAKNVATVPGSSERVEFAIRLPGRDGEGSVVHLPIDAKFPQEDYLRLQEAYEAGDLAALEDSRKALRVRILAEARTICSKYLSPPHTTDFALLFVPTEGLYAEALRLPG